MKNFLLIAFGASFAAFILTGCGCGGNRANLAAAIASGGLANKVADEQKAGADKWAERKAKGDTMAMAYADLENYLPDVSGYTKDGGPKGSTMGSMMGMGGLSTAEQKYVNGDKHLTVSIIDYNAAYQVFAGATAVFKMGISNDDDDKKQGPADLGIKDVTAYQTVYKKQPNEELALIVGQRFVVQIQSQGSNDPSLLTSVANGMKLPDLASK